VFFFCLTCQDESTKEDGLHYRDFGSGRLGSWLDYLFLRQREIVRAKKIHSILSIPLFSIGYASRLSLFFIFFSRIVFFFALFSVLLTRGAFRKNAF
jgi:hypothetical protein